MQPMEKETDPVVSFSLALSSESSGTRAEGDVTDKDGTDKWENGTDPAATEFDNRINSLTAILYSVVDGELNIDHPLGEIIIDPSSYQNKTNGNLKLTGRLKTNLSPTLLENDNNHYRIVVYINAPASGNWALDTKKPQQCRFSFHGTSADFSGIPMYGVARCFFKNLTTTENSETNPFIIKGDKNGLIDLSIPVLRSMAKIKVSIDGDLYKNKDEGGRTMRLKSLTVSRHANTGYLVPKGWNTTDNFLNNTMESVMNAFTGSENYTDRSCTVEAPDQNPSETWKNSDKMLRFYIPDTYNSDNDGYDSEPIKLTLEYFLDGETDLEKVNRNDIFICQYKEDGTHDVEDSNHERWDIIRNHIYEFVIKGVEASTGDLNISVSVKKWVPYHYDLNEDDVLVTQ